MAEEITVESLQAQLEAANLQIQSEKDKSAKLEEEISLRDKLSAQKGTTVYPVVEHDGSKYQLKVAKFRIPGKTDVFDVESFKLYEDLAEMVLDIDGQNILQELK